MTLAAWKASTLHRRGLARLGHPLFRGFGQGRRGGGGGTVVVVFRCVPPAEGQGQHVDLAAAAAAAGRRERW